MRIDDHHSSRLADDEPADDAPTPCIIITHRNRTRDCYRDSCMHAMNELTVTCDNSTAVRKMTFHEINVKLSH